MVLSLERTTNIGRNNISQFLLEDFKIGHQSSTHFYFGCILSHRTKALKKTKKDPLKKQKRKVNSKKQAYLHQREQGWGGLLGNVEATVSLSTRSLVCASLSAGQEGTTACGEADSFAGSHLLLRPKSRQNLALQGSCHPANPRHSRDTARRMPAKSCRSHLLHVLFHVGGQTKGYPFCQILWCLCTSQGEVRERKRKQLV